ncbi:hypothetical protein MBAV_005697 [Candidatus Magnetobacterium bavaricum]|uniref:Uncharacterized protein n=1 Tax=Candidatus Magnetobacterium bavaricum TaxID=29290 RepID=A0A0F3GJK0_9BACT|nr:hypothetical protein MBAV_005697 [Candidatus Magnetobacterium bavaricum]
MFYFKAHKRALSGINDIVLLPSGMFLAPPPCFSFFILVIPSKDGYRLSQVKTLWKADILLVVYPCRLTKYPLCKNYGMERYCLDLILKHFGHITLNTIRPSNSGHLYHG